MPCKATALSQVVFVTDSEYLHTPDGCQSQQPPAPEEEHQSSDDLQNVRKAMLLINLDAHVLMPTRQMLAKNLTSISVMSAQLTSPSQTLKLALPCTPDKQ